MKQSEEYVKISVKLEKDEDGYPPVDWEDLWAISLEDSRFRIDNVPFYAVGISYGDIVSAMKRGDKLVFTEVTEAKGNSTLRVIAYEENIVKNVRDELSAIGCSTEISNIPTFFSIDVPREIDYSKVAEILNIYTQKGLIDYQESALRH
jgi:hypothetical protein